MKIYRHIFGSAIISALQWDNEATKGEILSRYPDFTLIIVGGGEKIKLPGNHGPLIFTDSGSLIFCGSPGCFLGKVIAGDCIFSTGDYVSLFAEDFRKLFTVYN